MPIFESHAHYLDSRFDPDRDALLQSLAAAGVERVMEVACAPADFLPALAPVSYTHLDVYKRQSPASRCSRPCPASSTGLWP